MESDMIKVVEYFDNESGSGNLNGALEQGSELVGMEHVASIELMPGQTLPGTGFQVQHSQDIPNGNLKGASTFGLFLRDTTLPRPLRKAFDELHATLPNVHLKARDVTRWRMAWRSYKRWWDSPMNPTLFPTLLVQRSKNWPEFDSIFRLPIILGFTTATFVYGGLHALAWSTHFDSATERILWRISSCFVMGGLPVILGLLHLGDTFERGGLYMRSRTKAWDACFFACELIIYLTAGLILIAYMFARAYLVVECFINLFNLPAGVYNTPDWSVYFPHISQGRSLNKEACLCPTLFRHRAMSRG